MPWTARIKLIQAPTSAQDSHGFAITLEGEAVSVWANKKSVGNKQFYEGMAMGVTETLRFDVHTTEYDGQPVVEYAGKRYSVLKTYIDPRSNGEYTELTLTDLQNRPTVQHEMY